jgi:DNA-binding NarL/FixJ family response regulator
MTVLIVDDNRLMRGMVRAVVTPLDAVVHECSDGDEAVVRCAALKPDWVLMDVSMPRMDGLTATRQIMASVPGTRVLIVTEHADPALRTAAVAAGARGYVLKENLFEILDYLISAGSENQ